MSAHMRKHPIERNNDVSRMRHAGVLYQFPSKVAKKYRMAQQTVSSVDIFANINKKYTKPKRHKLFSISHERIYQFILVDKEKGGQLYKHLRHIVSAMVVQIDQMLLKTA